MSLKVIDKSIYLNDMVISKKVFQTEDIVEVVDISPKYIDDFYALTHRDIADNIEVYCNRDNYSLNLFKENDSTYLSMAVEILDKEDIITIESFNDKVAQEFSVIDGVQIVADEDSIEDSLNIILSGKLEDNESIKEQQTKINNAYEKLMNSIFL